MSEDVKCTAEPVGQKPLQSHQVEVATECARQGAAAREWCDAETGVHTHLYKGSTFQRCHGIAEGDELEREGT